MRLREFGSSPSKQVGAALLDVALGLIIAVAGMSLALTVTEKRMNSADAQVAAQQANLIGAAAAGYIKDNYAAVSAVATATTPANITIPMLISGGYLPNGYVGQNIYGQTYSVLALQPVAGKLQTLMVTTGGQTIPDGTALEIANDIGGAGGAIFASNPANATGTMGGWSIPVAQYKVNPGAGHLAVGLFYDTEGQLVDTYLYRNPVAGHPELNGMNAPINMNGNDITAAGHITANGETLAGGSNANSLTVGQAVFYGDTNAAIRTNGTVYLQNLTGGAPAPLNSGDITSGNITSTGTIHANADISAGGRIATTGYSPTSGYPAGWYGGLHAWDIYSESAIGVGQGGSLNASIVASTGNISTNGSIYAAGNIQSGAAIIGSSLYTPGHLGVGGNADINGNIASNGTITGNNISAANQLYAGGDVYSNGFIQAATYVSAVNMYASNSIGAPYIDAYNGLTTGGSFGAAGNITAGGSITANGVITSNSYFNAPQGNAYNTGAVSFYGDTQNGAVRMPGGFYIQHRDGSAADIMMVGNINSSGNLSTSGNVIANKFLANEGSTTNGGYSFTQDGAQDTGMFSPSDGVVDIYDNAVNTIHITPGAVAANVALSAPSIYSGGDVTAAGAVYASNWLRTYGATGWYSQTYGGGFYMTDGSWVRSYQDKGIYTGGQMQAGNMQSNGSINANGVISTQAYFTAPAGNAYNTGGVSYYGDGTNAAIRMPGTLYIQHNNGTPADISANNGSFGATVSANIVTANLLSSNGDVNLAGNLNASGNVSGNLLHVNAVGSAGGACPTAGYYARDGNGSLLSCVGGVWTLPGGATTWTIVNGPTTYGNNVSYAVCPAGYHLQSGGFIITNNPHSVLPGMENQPINSTTFAAWPADNATGGRAVALCVM